VNSKFFLEVDSDKEKNLDKDTIIKIRSGDSKALDSIMNKYKSFVYSRAKPFFIVGAEKEDIIQEGMIGLFKAIKCFDISKDVSFKAFADLCIKRQIITAIKGSTRQKHMPLNSYLSLNKCAFDEEGDRTLIEVLDLDLVPDPLETVANKETCKKIELKMGQVLSDFEQQVFNGYLNGDSYVEIASNLATHVKAVDNAIQRIKKKVEKHILSDMEMM
jgi:RNA polymerase sporulation-specific sigma factor